MTKRRWIGGAIAATTLAALTTLSDARAAPPSGAPVVHPADVLAEKTGLGPGVSRAVTRVVRTIEEAIPVIAEAKVRAGAGDSRIVLVAYQVSENEACVRAQAPEGARALRAARQACRSVRGVASIVAAVRCVSPTRDADACASTEMLWSASLESGAKPPEGVRHFRETVSSIRLVDANVDADPELETIVDWVREESYTDALETRSGGDVFSAFHEAMLVDADGAVLVRTSLAGGAYEDIASGGTQVHARIAADGVRFAVTTCALTTPECRPTWTTPRPIAREEVHRPTAPAVLEEAPPPAGG